MTMQFVRAERAQAPDMAAAAAQQAKIDQQRRNAEQLRMQGYGSGAMKVADELELIDPAKDWAKEKLAGMFAQKAAEQSGAALLGGTTSGLGASTVAASPLATAAAPSTTALLAGTQASPAIGASLAGTAGGLSTTAPIAAGTAGAAGGAAGAAGAAGGAAGGGGMAAAAPALLSNPIGWGVLAALALGAMYQADQ